MATYVDLEELKNKGQAFFLVFSENGELVMEPHCFCGEVLEENFTCVKCRQTPEISCFVCKEHELLPVIEKLMRGHPEFRHFSLYLLRGSV